MARGKATQLTDPGIGKISRAPAGTRIERFDRGQPGLALRITDRGVKSWVVFYRLDGKQVRETLGNWPVVAVAEARQKARQSKQWAKAGVDPRAERARLDAAEKAAQEDAEKRNRTFAATAEHYIENKCPTLEQGRDVESTIRRELIPRWGKRRWSSLEKSDAVELLDEIVAEGNEGKAYAMTGLIKRLGFWAEDRGHVRRSPFARLKSPVPKPKRTHYLSHHDIAVAWPVFGEMGYPFGPFFKMLMLTGLRRDEVADMRWREVDLKKKVWTIPAPRTKYKEGVYVVPLSDMSVAILEDLPRFAKGDYVFTTMDGKRPISGFDRAKRRAFDMIEKREREARPEIEGDDEQEDVRPVWVPHDFRRTVQTELSRLGIPEIVSDGVLNHKRQGLSAIYNQYDYGVEKREALQKWANALRDIVSPPPENVVRMREAQHGAS